MQVCVHGPCVQANIDFGCISLAGAFGLDIGNCAIHHFAIIVKGAKLNFKALEALQNRRSRLRAVQHLLDATQAQREDDIGSSCLALLECST